LVKNKLRILFRTTGGKATKKELGFGHVYRCVNLAESLKGNNLFFLIEDYGGVEEVIRKKRFQNLYKLPKNVSIESDIQKTINFIINKQIDILIIDKFNPSKKFVKQLKKYVQVVVISDLLKIEYPAHLIVNGFVGFENKITKNKMKSRCLLGPSFQILESKFSKKRARMDKEYDLLASFGGYDENNIIQILMEELLKFKGRLKTKIILGPATKKSNKISLLEKKLGNSVKVVKSTDDMYGEISSARFGLCSGGITSYEFAALQIPFAIICQVRHQMITANEWQNRSFAKNLGIIDGKTHQKLYRFLFELVEKKIHQKTMEKPLVDGKGSKLIAKEIIKLKMN